MVRQHLEQVVLIHQINVTNIQQINLYVCIVDRTYMVVDVDFPLVVNMCMGIVNPEKQGDVDIVVQGLMGLVDYLHRVSMNIK